MGTISEYIVDHQKVNSEMVLIGNDAELHKTVLIKTDDEKVSVKLKTDNLVLKTGIPIEQKDGSSLGRYHIIQCISEDLVINNQFARICAYAFANITHPMPSDFAISNFQNLQLLFETSAAGDTHSLQVGVYGELLFLHFLCDNEMRNIAQKWHSNFYLKHDMEIDEKHRIEIKTTNKEKRIHTFNHNQLCQENVEILVASIMVEETELGYSLYELVLDTMDILDNPKQKMELEKLMRLCNINSENQGIVCDRQHVYNNIKVYELDNVPKLLEKIPAGVSCVQYDVSLETAVPSDISILK